MIRHTRSIHPCTPERSGVAVNLRSPGADGSGVSTAGGSGKRLSAVLALMLVVLAGGDAGPATTRGWQWWQARVVIDVVVSGTVIPMYGQAGGTVSALPEVAGPCGVVGDRRFDPRLLCPADLGPDWSATDFPTMLLVGCEPYGRTDTVGLIDNGPPPSMSLDASPDKPERVPPEGAAPTGVKFEPAELRERLIERPTPAAAVALLTTMAHKKRCRDLGHGFTSSEPVRTTIDSLPAVTISDSSPIGSGRTAVVAVGSQLLVAWTHGSSDETRDMVTKAIERVRSPRQQPEAVDVSHGWQYRCIGPAACAAQDAVAGY
jgi:hypothetical protein